MWRAKQPYNVSVAAETAALAALRNETYMADVRQKLIDERARLFEKLSSIPFLEPYPSEANFLLCQVRARPRGCALPQWSCRQVVVPDLKLSRSVSRR